MYGDVVLGVESKRYEEILEKARKDFNVVHDSQLPAEALMSVCNSFKELATVPQDPWEQLKLSIEAVFCSWYENVLFWLSLCLIFCY